MMADMRRLVLAALLGLAATTGFVQDEPVDKVGFGLGYRLGQDVRQGLSLDGVGVDPDMLVRGFADGLGNHTPLIDQQELQAILTSVHHEMQDRLARRLQAEDEAFRRLSEKNLAMGRDFREAFGKRPGVVTMPDGLQYEVVTPGDGASPQATDVVDVSYRFVRLDGSKSVEGVNELVAVDGVFEGGRRILQMMKVGATWNIAVPPALAFGAMGSYPDVGPNETLLGRVELHGIQPGGAAP
jgi:FKBP-type peptidyl-prolyl cis-trans isomerase